MRLIVDGNNVMGSRPDGWWRDRAAAAARLSEQIASWARTTGQHGVVVVFDGQEPASFVRPAGVEVRFAERPGRDAADDVITALVADAEASVKAERVGRANSVGQAGAATDPKAMASEVLTVVTSDAALARRVRAHGAVVTGAGGFRDALRRA